MKAFYFFLSFIVFGLYPMVAQTTDVVTGLNKPQGILLNGDYLFIAESGENRISRIDISDETPTVSEWVTGLDQPRQITLNGNNLYIAETSAGRISKADITQDPPVVTEVVSGLDKPQGILLNGDYLFIAESGKNRISRIDISASSPTITTVVNGLDDPRQIALKENDLFIVESGSSNKVSKIDITKSTPLVEDVVLGFDSPNFILLENCSLYVAEGLGRKISKIDLNKDPIEAMDVVVTNLTLPAGIAAKKDEIYVSDIVENKIIKFIDESFEEDEDEEKEEENSSLVIYPNPFTNYLKISGLKSTLAYKIYNVLGVEILKGSISPDKQIQLKVLSKGVYFLKLDNGKTFKIIKI